MTDNDETPLHTATRTGMLLTVQKLVEDGALIDARTSSGNTPLIVAADKRREDIFKYLVDKGANINSCNNIKWTPLHYTARNGMTDTVSWLLSMGADIDAVNNMGYTPLLVAAKSNQTYAHKLLQYADAERTCPGSYDKTLLLFAAENGWVTQVKFILEKGSDIYEEDVGSDSPLFLAVLNKHKFIVKLLIEEGANINCCNSFENYTLLHYASINGWLGIVKALLRRGAPIEARDLYGNTALLLAADKEYKDIVSYLIHKGADLNYCNNNRWTVLHYASRNGWLDIVQSLLTKRIDLDARILYFGKTPLLLAAECTRRLHDGRSTDIIMDLVNAGANIHCFDSAKWTILHYAAKNEWHHIVQFLIDKGADINLKTEIGHTPLLIAANHACIRTVEFLLDIGADFNCADNNKWTLLHYASRCGWLDIVKSILEKKADINAKTSLECTPLYVACKHGRTDVVEHLINSGADVNIECNEGISPLSNLLLRAFNVESVKLIIERGAYLDSPNYKKVLNWPTLKEGILRDVKLCSQSIFNKFNYKDLTELYKLCAHCTKLPPIEKMRIVNTNQVTHETIERVKHQIQEEKYCNILKACPINLRMLSVKSFISYCKSKEKLNVAKKLKIG